jgi:hypothetical protein
VDIAGGIKLVGVDDLGGELGRPERRNEERRVGTTGDTCGDSDGIPVLTKGREVWEQWMSEEAQRIRGREMLLCLRLNRL